LYLNAATLIDGHVNNHGACLHFFEVVLLDEQRRACPWNQHSSNNLLRRTPLESFFGELSRFFKTQI